jgi:hypothetical protein
MGTYSEWDEEKKLKFLVTELKGKRPLIPPTIEVCILLGSLNFHELVYILLSLAGITTRS